MTDDGWKPIVGTSKQNYREGITQYRNPIQTSETVEAETNSPSLKTNPNQQSSSQTQQPPRLNTPTAKITLKTQLKSNIVIKM